MTAILSEHVEWATVDRMRRMLQRPQRGFEVTGTLALFTGILCWTLQRIRTDERETDDIAARMHALAENLGNQPFQSFLKTGPQALLKLREDRRVAGTEIALNSLAEFATDEGPLDAFRSLVALRNSVAHQDARRLFAINNAGQVIGFRFACKGLSKTTKWPKDESWSGNLCLDAAGMTSIAGELADQFCRALQDGDDRFATDAGRVKEAAAR
jgi:hypothetical protein